MKNSEFIEVPENYHKAHVFGSSGSLSWWTYSAVMFACDPTLAAISASSILEESVEGWLPTIYDRWLEKEKPVSENRIKVCTSVLLTNQKGQVLLARRKGDVPASGWLGTPAGKVEFAEKVMDCAHREFREETGASLGFVKQIAVREHIRFCGHYIVFYFHATSYSGQIKNLIPDKSEDWKWHDIDRIDPSTCLEPMDILEMVKPKRLN